LRSSLLRRANWAFGSDMKLAVLEVKRCVNAAAACETPCMRASEQRVLDTGTKGTLSHSRRLIGLGKEHSVLPAKAEVIWTSRRFDLIPHNPVTPGRGKPKQSLSRRVLQMMTCLCLHLSSGVIRPHCSVADHRPSAAVYRPLTTSRLHERRT
jgi:hypothetical protein